MSVMERNMPWGDGLVYTTGLRREISEEGVGRDRLVNMQGINKVSKYIKGNGSMFLTIRERSYKCGKGKTRVNSVLLE